MDPGATKCTGLRQISASAKLNAAGIVLAVLATSLWLWPAWIHDDNLAHGVFLPILTAILIFESRRDQHPRFIGGGPVSFASCVMLSSASLISVTVATVYAAALGWNHGMAQLLVCVSLVFLLGAAWLAFSTAQLRIVPINWAAAAAVLLWVFAAPPPSGTYSRLALFLQGRVTEAVVGVLHSFGIAAYRDGNLINLARTSVGVSEACSGVRSLISCAVAGLFLSAVAVRRPVSRAIIIIASPFIGLGMNMVRSLILTLLANSGVPIEGRWHDLTGDSIIAFTALLVASLAMRLRYIEKPRADPPFKDPGTLGLHSSLQAVVAATLIIVAGFVAFGVYVGVTANRIRAQASRAPDLTALLPEPAKGWIEITTPDLDQFSGVLQTHDLVERVYASGSGSDGPRITLYVAYWRAGEAPVTLVDSHTPDACWPGTGWVAKPVSSERAGLSVAGRALPLAEFRLFAHGRFQTNVWFWHIYGGKPLAFVDPYSAIRLFSLSLRYGFREPKDQLFVRISSNRPWEEIASSPMIKQFMVNIKPFGL